MGRRARVAFLVTGSGIGGAERQVADLALGMRSRGWDVAAISMLPQAETFDDLSAKGVMTVSLGMRQGFGDPRAVWHLARWLRDWRPDVLHAHMVHANLLARVTRVFVSIPVLICTIHNQYQGARWRHRAYRLTDRLADVTTAVSERAMQDAIAAGGAPAGHVMVVPNGVELSTYRVDDATRARVRGELAADGRFVWLAVGRLTAAKDPHSLIEAFARLSRERRGSRLLLAGDGPLRPEIAAHIEEAGVEAGVVLLGIRDDVPDLMRAADGYVMSSAWEGLPLVLLEAAASSLPIVATDVGGNREVVQDGASGFIVPPSSPAALADAMRRIERLTEAQRRAMGQVGREGVLGKFDLEVVLDRWEALYEEQLLRKGLARGSTRS